MFSRRGSIAFGLLPLLTVVLVMGFVCLLITIVFTVNRTTTSSASPPSTLSSQDQQLQSYGIASTAWCTKFSKDGVSSIPAVIASRGAGILAFGPAEKIGNGRVRSFIRVSDAGRLVPIELGLSFGDAALTGLPYGPECKHYFSSVVAVPELAFRTGIDHISMDWNPHGHRGLPQFETEHFDAHFYFKNQYERGLITPDDCQSFPLMDNPEFNPVTNPFVPPKLDTDLRCVSALPNQPPSPALPVGVFTIPATCEPNMGAHAMDMQELGAILASPAKFTQVMAYGYFNNSAIFLEPMLSVQWLKTIKANRITFTRNVAQPVVYPAGVEYFPTKFTVRYAENCGEYRISFSEFVQTSTTSSST